MLNWMLDQCHSESNFQIFFLIFIIFFVCWNHRYWDKWLGFSVLHCFNINYLRMSLRCYLDWRLCLGIVNNIFFKKKVWIMFTSAANYIFIGLILQQSMGYVVDLRKALKSSPKISKNPHPLITICKSTKGCNLSEFFLSNFTIYFQ